MKNKKIHIDLFYQILEYNNLKRTSLPNNFRYLAVTDILNKTSNILLEFMKWFLIFFYNDETCLQIKLRRIVVHICETLKMVDEDSIAKGYKKLCSSPFVLRLMPSRFITLMLSFLLHLKFCEFQIY